MDDPHLYTRETIDSLDWPATDEGEYAQRYLLPFVQNGPGKYIANVHNTTLAVAKIGEAILPLTITNFHPENTYTVSPYSHYISYGGYEEVERLQNSMAEAAIRAVMHPIAWLFRRSDFDRVVYVNNWLLSTNLYPSLERSQIEALAQMLPEQFPDRAIVWRSVDQYRNRHVYETLQQCGYHMVLSRQVWYQDPLVARQKKQFKVDLSVVRRSPYEVVYGSLLNDAELRRVLELYNMLYIEKYSHLNPQFTEAFIQLAGDCDLLHIRVLRCEGRVDGVLGYFVRNGVMTQPLFGYDTSLPQRLGLYRILSIQTLLEGLERGLLVHASAGVGPFKRLRGGVPVIEYNAVFDRHLPMKRRLPWRVLQALSESIAIPLFQKYGF